MTIAYTVTCTVEDPDVARRYEAWIRDAHFADVLAAGASSATLLRLDGDPATFEMRYTFADREAFERYEREEAPGLRAEGLRRFPPELGLRYRRSVGDVLCEVRSEGKSSPPEVPAGLP